MENVKGRTEDVTYAGFWVRFVSICIDSILVFIGMIILSHVSVLTFSILYKDHFEIPTFVATAWACFEILLFFGYVIFLPYQYGGTPGKRFMGLRIVSKKQSTLSLVQVVMREIPGKLLSGFLAGLGFLAVAVARNKRGLHDMIANTAVIHDPASQRRSRVFVGFLAAIFLVGGIGVGTSMYAVTQSIMQQKHISAYKAEISMLPTHFQSICPARDITQEDFSYNTDNGPHYHNSDVTFASLEQNCGPAGNGKFSFAVQGIKEARGHSAVCSQVECSFTMVK